MKKTTVFTLSILIILLCTSTSFAFRGKTMDLKLGFLNPGDAKTGFIIGGRFGSQIDNRINVGISLDFYRNSGYDYSSDGDDNEKIVDARFSSNILPIMIDLTADFPLKTNKEITPFAHLGLGYEVLWNKEEYRDNPDDDDTRTYTGFGWMIGGGVFYKIGYNSDLIVELFYNHCTAKRDEGKWVIQEMDISGLGARAGIRIAQF
jgi:opacity protein-like surface antigen